MIVVGKRNHELKVGELVNFFDTRNKLPLGVKPTQSLLALSECDIHKARPIEKKMRVLLAVGTLTSLALALLRVAQDHLTLHIGPFGFEWTERYGTLLKCGGRDMLLTRIRYIGKGKYFPVLRYKWNATARILWRLPHLGFNPTLVCVNNAPYVVGSRHNEWHIFNDRNDRVLPKVSIASLDGKIRDLNVNMSSCIEHHFATCALDGKFSIVRRNSEWYAFIRANVVAESGGRHVQMTQAPHLHGPWSPFQLINIQDVTLAADSNIYIFEVQVVNHSFVAQFPAVFRNSSGIFTSRSEDGIRWSKPLLVRFVKNIGSRLPLLPVGTDYLMHINLWLNTKSVWIQGQQGQMLRGFHTRRLV